eukprot:GCRY01002063.1.p1 GENE.GCRY01002063.1~~GCRY01002063.1.p1  ORF type:complete len:715 (-),score=165.85 GCRY01002063.1:801-2945(-)
MEFSKKRQRIVDALGFSDSEKRTKLLHIVEENVAEIDDDEVSILKFQKRAMFARIKQYRVEILNLKERVHEFEASEARFKEKHYILLSSWRQLGVELSLLFAEILPFQKENEDINVLLQKLKTIEHSCFADNIEALSCEDLGVFLKENCEFTKAILLNLLQLREQLRDQFRAQEDNDHSVSVALYEKFDNLLAQFKELSAELTFSRGKEEALKTTVQKLYDERDALRDDVDHVTRAYERLRAKAAQSQTQEHQGSAGGGTSPTSTPSDGQPTHAATPPPEATAVLEQEVAHWQQMADSRLTEIQCIRGERARLKKEVDTLRMQVLQPSEDRVVNSRSYLMLAQQLQFTALDLENAMRTIQSLQADIQTLLQQHARDKETLEQAEGERRAALECALTEAVTELRAVRTERLNAKQALEHTSGELEVFRVQNKRLRELEILLKLKENDPRASQRMEALFVDRRKMHEQSEEVEKLQEKVATLQAKLAVAQAPDVETQDITELREREKQLLAKIENYPPKVEALRKELAASQSGTDGMLEEIANIGKAFEELQEQNTRLARGLSQKDEVISQLVMERSKERQAAHVNKELRRSLEKEIGLSQNKLNEQKALLVAMDAKYRAAMDLVEKLREEVRIFGTAVETHRAQSQSLSSQVEEMSVEGDTVKSQLSTALKTAHQATDDVNVLDCFMDCFVSTVHLGYSVFVFVFVCLFCFFMLL